MKGVGIVVELDHDERKLLRRRPGYGGDITGEPASS